MGHPHQVVSDVLVVKRTGLLYLSYNEINFRVMYLWNVGICGVRWRSVIGATFDWVREERGICINWRCTDEQPGGINELGPVKYIICFNFPGTLTLHTIC